jgi:hypothetical protein
VVVAEGLLGQWRCFCWHLQGRYSLLLLMVVVVMMILQQGRLLGVRQVVP